MQMYCANITTLYPYVITSPRLYNSLPMKSEPQEFAEEANFVAFHHFNLYINDVIKFMLCIFDRC